MLEVYQLAERHLEDRFRLHRGERIGGGHPPLVLEHGEALIAQRPLHHGRGALDRHQALLCFGLRLRLADDLDNPVNVGEGQQQPLNRVLLSPRSDQQVLRPAAQHMGTMSNELDQQLLDVQLAGLAVHEGKKNHRERILQRRELVELIQDHMRVGIAAKVDQQLDWLFQIADILDASDSLDLVSLHQGRDFLDHAIASLLEGNFGDDDSRPALFRFLDLTAGSNDNRAAAGVERTPNRLSSADNPPGWKIGTRHHRHQLIDRNIRIVEHHDQGIANLTQIVGRNRGRHADRDPVGTVNQQIGEAAGQDNWLGPPFIIRRHKIDRVQLQIVEHHRRKRAEPSLGVPHGGRRQTRDRAKVPLLVDQGVPHVPLLGHPDQGGINDTLAVGVVVTTGITGDLRTFDPRRTGAEVQIIHRDKNPPL